MRYNPEQTPDERWKDDSLQFCRLLAEIRAVGLTKRQVADISESMDLPVESLVDLLDRAGDKWDAYLATIPKGVHLPSDSEYWSEVDRAEIRSVDD